MLSIATVLSTRRRRSVDRTFLSSAVYDAAFSDLGTLTLGTGLIVIAVKALSISATSATVASITINGVSATLLKAAKGSGAGTDMDVEFWAAPCYAATGNVTVNWNGTVLRGGYGMWLVKYSSGGAHATASAIIDNPSVTLNVPAGGLILAASANVVGTVATTWVGVNENYDELIGGANTYQSGASQLFTEAVTPRTVSNDNTGTSGVAMAVVSFGPR